MHHTSGPDGVDCLIIVPDLALVQLYHDVKGAFGSILVRVLQERQDEVLQLLIDVLVLCLLVDVLHVLDDAAMEELT